MFKSRHTDIPDESLDRQFSIRKLRRSKRPPPPPLPPDRRNAPLPQPPIGINTFPTEILYEIFLFALSSSISDHRPSLECRHHRHPAYKTLLTCSPSMIISHICQRWRDIIIAYPLLSSFISTQDLYCEKWIRILLSRLRRINPHSLPTLHPTNGGTNDNLLLSIRLQICSSQTERQICRQLALLRHLIHESSSVIKNLFVDVAGDEAFKQMFEPGDHPDEWFLLVNRHGLVFREMGSEYTNVEELHISKYISCDGLENTTEDRMIDVKKGEENEEQYISYLNFCHTPSLFFISRVVPSPLERWRPMPRLQKLSLMNCYIPGRQLKGFNNIEELTVTISQPAWACGSAWYWKNVAHNLPNLRRLSIDGALGWRAREVDFRVPPMPKERHFGFERCSYHLEELIINRCSPLWVAAMLHSFIKAPSPLDDPQQKKWLRKLQITCTDIKDDEDLRELCKAVGAWFNRWNSWTHGKDGGYLYLSIGPSGIIVHNRRENITGNNHSNHEAKTATDEEPEIQLTLYSRSTLELDLIADVLSLISPTPDKLDITSGPFIVSCEELELSIGLLDIEDNRFEKVFKDLVEIFGKTKRLKRLGCVGSMTARALLTREYGELNLLSTLESLRFDHVDFSNLDQVPNMVSDFPTCVKFVKCCNVRREWVSKLQDLEKDVSLERGTSIVEMSKNDKKVEKER